MNYYKHTDWNGKLELRDNWVTIALHIEENEKLIETHTLTGDKDYWIIGRTAGTGLSSQTPAAIVDIEATHPSCSRQHCVIQLRAPDHVYLFDLSSSGTYVNHVRIKRLTYHRLRNVDVIRAGRSPRSMRIELHEQEVPGPTETTDSLLSIPGSLPSNLELVVSRPASSPVSPRNSGAGLSDDKSSSPRPPISLLQRSFSQTPTNKRKLAAVHISPRNSRSKSSDAVRSVEGGDRKRLRMNSSNIRCSRSRSPNIQPMTKPYEKALREEERLFLSLETIKQRLYLLEIVRAEQRLESKKDLADKLKFDDTDDSPRRSSTMNEYLESFSLEFLPNFQKASDDLQAEQEQLMEKWKAARVEMKKLRPPLIPRVIPVLCVSPRSRTASIDGSFMSFPSIKLN